MAIGRRDYRLGRRRANAMANDARPGSDAAQAASDDDLIVRLYREENPRLVRYFYRNSVTRAEADELAQETFLRFVRSGAAKMLNSPQHYLRRIATNLLRDWVDRSSTRVARSKSPLSDAEEIPGDSDQHRALAAREDLAFCEKLLLDLEPLDREIFLLNRVDGYSFRDIGKRMGLSEWAVKRNMLKTLSHLMSRMENR